MSVRYEAAADGDAAAIAGLHAASWQATYRGILPDAFLDGDVLGERRAAWARRFADRSGSLTLVARDDGGLAGYVHCLLDEDPEWGTLLDHLHVRPDLKRQGLGRRLMGEAAARLRERDPAGRLYLWVIEANPAARRFYAALGGEEAGPGTWQAYGADVPLVRMAWASLDAVPVTADGVR